MSKICEELVKATELSTKRGEERQDFLLRLIKAVQGLSDAEWDQLSDEAQGWFNAAVDAKNAKAKDVPDFPDLPKAEPESNKTSRRRGSSSDEKEAPAAKVGAKVEITTKRGKKITGKIVELDKEVMVIDTGDGEEEVALDRIESTSVFHGDAEPGDDKADTVDPIKVGAEVTVKTKRGKEFVGKIVELDDEVLVLKTADGEEELSRDRIDTITPAKGSAKANDEAKSSRRSSAKDDDKGGDDGDSKKRASNGGVSVGTRIKEIIADNIDATEADVAKILKKEGLEFRENTLKLNFADCHKFLDVLKAKKLLKV